MNNLVFGKIIEHIPKHKKYNMIKEHIIYPLNQIIIQQNGFWRNVDDRDYKSRFSY